MSGHSRNYYRGYVVEEKELPAVRKRGEVLEATGTDGTAAAVREPKEKERQKNLRLIKSKERRARKTALFFTAAALIVMAVCLLKYLELNTSITAAVTEIAELEEELNDLKTDNEEMLNAIESSISLDEIKYRAMTELGMSYPTEDQIVHYSAESQDYVKQLIYD